MPATLKKYFFPALLLIFVVSFFARNNFRNVEELDPSVLSNPIQTPITQSEDISFSRDGYEYHLKPLYDYEVNALVVSKMDYRLFSLNKYENVFPVDLCLIWGSSVSSGAYKDKSLRFSQDCRWCWAYWARKNGFDLKDMSNNHLVISDSQLLPILKRITKGDQVKIRGKLVNVKAIPLGSARSNPLTWNTSVSRSDQGAGACEIIYAQELEILREANRFYKILFKLSSLVLVLYVLAKIIA